jgi:ethanolamine ammonia-lyase small subunit
MKSRDLQRPDNSPWAPWVALRAATPARIGLQNAGAAIATRDHLAFQRAHAEARDAVHERLDVASLAKGMRALDLDILNLRSAAPDRHTYLLRPDLGRRLDDDSRAKLETLPRGFDIVFAVADGLSARAVERHAQNLLEAVLPKFRQSGWRIGPACIVEQGRVAIGDEIGFMLESSLAAVFIGERPGLSSPDSLGVYLTWAPALGRHDAERNCLSNIRVGGMSYAEAADRLFALCIAARQRKLTGVLLKDQTPAFPVP